MWIVLFLNLSSPFYKMLSKMTYQRSFTVEEVLQKLGFNNNTPKRQNCNIIDEVNEDVLGDDKDNFDTQFVGSNVTI